MAFQFNELKLSSNQRLKNGVYEATSTLHYQQNFDKVILGPGIEIKTSKDIFEIMSWCRLKRYANHNFIHAFIIIQTQNSKHQWIDEPFLLFLHNQKKI